MQLFVRCPLALAHKRNAARQCGPLAALSPPPLPDESHSIAGNDGSSRQLGREMIAPFSEPDIGAFLSGGGTPAATAAVTASVVAPVTVPAAAAAATALVVPHATVDRMHAILEAPQPDKLAWEACTLQLGAEELDSWDG